MMPADTPEARLIALDERLREKKRHRRRVLVHRIGILASILALLSAGVWLVCFSSFFRFAASRTVLDGVGGDSIVREVDVAQVLEAYEGKPLIFTSMSKLSEDLQGIPEVNHAQAHVRFPRTVVIEVTPQTPAACVGTRDSCTAIADDGSLLRIPEEETKVLPRLILSDS